MLISLSNFPSPLCYVTPQIICPSFVTIFRNFNGSISSSSLSCTAYASKPLTLYFRIKGPSSRIPAAIMPRLTSTADQVKTGTASTVGVISECLRGRKGGKGLRTELIG